MSAQTMGRRVVQVGNAGEVLCGPDSRVGVVFSIAYPRSWRAAGAVSRRLCSNLLAQLRRAPNAEQAVMRYSQRRVACLSSEYDPPRATTRDDISQPCSRNGCFGLGVLRFTGAGASACSGCTLGTYSNSTGLYRCLLRCVYLSGALECIT